MDSARSFTNFLESMSGQEEEFNTNIDWLSVDLYGSEAIQGSDPSSECSIGAGSTRDFWQTCKNPDKEESQSIEGLAAQGGGNQAEVSGRLSSGLLPLQPTISGTDSVEVPGLDSLEELVDRLKHADCDTIESKENVAAILRHPDHLKNTSELKVYSKLSGGLKYYSPGTPHAWLYKPQKRKRDMNHDGNLENAADSAALVLVYPEISGPSSSNDDESKKAFHFGGRANTFRNGSDERLKIQHGSCRALGLKARKFQLVAAKQHIPRNLDGKTLGSSSPKKLNSEDSPECLKPLALPAKASAESNHLDAALDAHVKNVRKDIEGNDLKYIKAVLNEVWTREAASHDAPARPLLSTDEVPDVDLDQSAQVPV